MTYDSAGESYMDMMRRTMGVAAGISSKSTQARLAGQCPPSESLSGDQLALYERIVADRGAVGANAGFGVKNEDGSLSGPWNAMVAASPKIGASAERLGHACRHDNSCPKDVYEVGILAIAAKRRSQFEWYAHEKLALSVGVRETTIADIKARKDELRDATNAQQALYTYAVELEDLSRVSEKTHRAALDALGGSTQPLVDFVFTIGFYSQIAFVLNAFQVQLPKGVPTPFPEEST